MTPPPQDTLSWQVADAASLRALDAWMVEVEFDLESIEAQDTPETCTFRVVKPHHDEARERPLRRLPFGRERILPAYEYGLTVRPAREVAIRCEEGEVTLYVRGVRGDGRELVILGANGKVTVRGEALVVSATQDRRHELDWMERVWPWLTTGRWRPRATP